MRLCVLNTHPWLHHEKTTTPCVRYIPVSGLLPGACRAGRVCVGPDRVQLAVVSHSALPVQRGGGDFLAGPLLDGLAVTLHVTWISLILAFAIGLTTAFPAVVLLRGPVDRRGVPGNGPQHAVAHPDILHVLRALSRAGHRAVHVRGSCLEPVRRGLCLGDFPLRDRVHPQKPVGGLPQPGAVHHAGLPARHPAAGRQAHHSAPDPALPSPWSRTRPLSPPSPSTT